MVLIEKTGMYAQKQCVMVFVLANANSSLHAYEKLPCLACTAADFQGALKSQESGAGSLSAMLLQYYCYNTI